MYLTEASKEWVNNRNRSRLNTNENYQQNPASYEYNEDADVNNHSYGERNEVENYNYYNSDGRKSTLKSTAVNTSYPKNIRNLDNLITHSQDGATHRDVKVNWNEKNASSSKNKYAEKTTYCRPVFNVYHQDYIYKAIERNAKLQLLLKKLVIARRKEKEEKERGEWNNYFNKLKNTGHYLSYESRHIEPRHMEARYKESRHMEARHMEPRHMDSQHFDSQHMEPRYIESRNIEPRHNESCARCCFEPSTQSHEFTKNPNSEVHTGPRFNNHPEHKRVPVCPGVESGHENRPHLSITSSFDKFLMLGNEWQSSTPHRIPVDRPRSPSRIPVDSGKSENDSKGYCERCLLANRKEESSRETYPATSTGGHFKTSLVPGRKGEESSKETYPATTKSDCCKACLLTYMKEEEGSRETYPATSTGGHFKTSQVPGIKEEESSRETYPGTTTDGICKACLLASRKEESSRETYPATTTGGHFKTSLVPGTKEESSRKTYPAITMCGHCKARFLASVKEEESSTETYPATTTVGICKACLLANRNEESSREKYPATSTGGHFKTSQVPGMKEEESSRETYPATTQGGCCKACFLASMKEEENSRETYPATSISLKKNVITQTSSIETTNIEFIITDQAAAKAKYEEITQNVNRLKNLIDLQDQEKQRRNALSGIETKIELLSNSIKAILSKLEAVRDVSDRSTELISGVHGFKNMAKSTSVSGDNVPVHEVENMTKTTNTDCDCEATLGEPPERPEQPVLPQKAKRPEQPVLPEKAERPEQPELPEKPERPDHPVDTFNFQTEYVVRPLPTKYRNISSSTSKIDKIMCEELVKSNQFRKDIEEILCQSNSACAVQISFDIPTRERCTEVTDSLSKTKLMEEQEISIEELTLLGDRNRQMTIAVNTEPMGLLAWFRMSSDTLKQLISYVPCVDYSRYLVRSPLPQLTTTAVDYVCNICGACFSRPSQLNNHIRTHDLTNTKNCCICHHVLNIKPHSAARSAARFACRYCGQRFTRAYCCELHEQSCARAMGVRHDVRSGHGLLR